MSRKINVFIIVKAHFSSLKEVGKKNLCFVDMLTFILLPALVSLLGLFIRFNLSKDLDSLLVNFGAIFTALLLSVIVLIYDQENRLIEKSIQFKNELGQVYAAKMILLKELYHNISYAILCSLLLVLLAFIHNALPVNIKFTEIMIPKLNFILGLSVATSIVTPLIVFLALNIFLTILMIVKRLYLILISNNPGI